MESVYSVVEHWQGGFNETGLQQWAESVRKKLPAPNVTLGLVFVTPKLFSQAAQVLEILRVHAQVPLLVGCSSASLIFQDQELEDAAGLVLGLFHLPDAKLNAFHLTQEQVEEANGPAYWHLETGIDPEDCNGWLAFADPFSFDSELWIKEWNAAYEGQPVMGGLSSGDYSEQVTQVYLNGEVFEEGAVIISVGGA